MFSLPLCIEVELLSRRSVEALVEACEPSEASEALVWPARQRVHELLRHLEVDLTIDLCGLSELKNLYLVLILHADKVWYVLVIAGDFKKYTYDTYPCLCGDLTSTSLYPKCEVQMSVSATCVVHHGEVLPHPQGRNSTYVCNNNLQTLGCFSFISSHILLEHPDFEQR